MNIPAPSVKIQRATHWTSPDGRYVVVQGPFPEGFIRSLDCSTVAEARDRASSGLVERNETTRKRYAKTFSKLVTQVENEWGEIAP